MKPSAILLATVATVATSAVAQNVVPIDIGGQPLTYMKDGQVNGCGIRYMGGRIMPSATMPIPWFDASVNVYLGNPEAAVKIASFDIDPKAMKADASLKRKVVAVKAGWFKAPGEAATTSTAGRTFEGMEKGTLLYPTQTDRALATLLATIEGRVISVGVQRITESNTWIYTGKVKLTEEERDQFAECMREFVRESDAQVPNGVEGAKK